METLRVILIVIGVIIAAYLIGRSLTKGVLKEIDLYFGKKFTNYINNKKDKEDDYKEKE